MQKISDPLLTVCAQCGKPTLVKMLTAAGFQLKGSGWYATDFKSKPVPSASKEAGDGGKKEDSKKEGGEKKAAGSGGDSAKTPPSTPGTGTA